MKTSELTGAALDWAVAKCEGLLGFGYRTDGERFAIEYSDGQVEGFMPSTDWAQSGSIIEQEGIELKYLGYENPPYWGAAKFSPSKYERKVTIGTTPLIAAMRCYVYSKLGDEIDVPNELTS